tara:strand:+ start:1532 stop:1735 length:204 start_codon:yes stop_codon:yes gene_type:complete
MGDSNKNGYEIRESLLGLAVGILDTRNATLRENEYLKPEGQQQEIQPYNVQEVLQTAETLYQFVSKK